MSDIMHANNPTSGFIARTNQILKIAKSISGHGLLRSKEYDATESHIACVSLRCD